MKLDTTRPFAGQRQLSRFGAEGSDFELTGGSGFCAVTNGLGAGLGTGLYLGAGCDAGLGGCLAEAADK